MKVLLVCLLLSACVSVNVHFPKAPTTSTASPQLVQKITSAQSQPHSF